MKKKSLANNLCNKKLYIVLDLDVMAKNQGVGSKIVLCKSCSELSLFLQYTTCTFGPAQRCNFMKVYEKKKIFATISFLLLI